LTKSEAVKQPEYIKIHVDLRYQFVMLRVLVIGFHSLLLVRLLLELFREQTNDLL